MSLGRALLNRSSVCRSWASRSFVTLVCLLLALSCSSTPTASTPSGFTTWQPQESGVSASLRGVSVVSDRVVWASGAEGTVLRTVDGGEHWTRCTLPERWASLDFRDVHGLDDERAWILSAGLPAIIGWTEDGGRSWSVQYESDAEGVFFDGMDFWDERSGIAFSDPIDGAFLILVTENGGAEWRPVARELLPPPIEGEAGFAGSGTCLRVFGSSGVVIGTGGGAARVLRSEDRGATWTVADSELGSSPSAGVFSVWVDGDRGCVVGGDYLVLDGSARVASVSADGGRSWTSLEGDGPTGFRSALVALNNRLLIAVGPSGTDQSSDGGKFWERISDDGYHALDAAPPAVAVDGYTQRQAMVWAVGSDGRIAKAAIVVTDYSASLQYRP